jgi:hypothetical protein
MKIHSFRTTFSQSFFLVSFENCFVRFLNSKLDELYYFYYKIRPSTCLWYSYEVLSFLFWSKSDFKTHTSRCVVPHSPSDPQTWQWLGARVASYYDVTIIKKSRSWAVSFLPQRIPQLLNLPPQRVLWNIWTSYWQTMYANLFSKWSPKLSGRIS